MVKERHSPFTSLYKIQKGTVVFTMQKSRTKKKILLVDDDEIQLYTTKALLQDEHCEVITHKSIFGIGVTNLVRYVQPDLILLDVNMPGLSGEQLSSLLRWRNSPFVFYSSDDEDSLRALVSKCGAKGYICKGNSTDLKEKVKLYLSLPACNAPEPVL